MRLTLVTYNVHRCIGRDNRFDPKRIAQVIQELDADIIALQEVETTRDGGLDLLNFITEETGFSAVAGPTMLREGGEYGNALLTRHTVAEINNVDLSHPGREPRGALNVKLDCEGIAIQTVATHLGLKVHERRKQVRHLLELLDKDQDLPAILMGDLNEWFLWGRPLKWLHAYFSYTPAPATFPARFPIFALDRIWVRPRSALKSVKVHVSTLSRIASDHLPVRAIAEW